MHKRTRRSIVIAILLAMILTVFAPMAAFAHTGTTTITIFHTNDIHGTYATGSKSIGFDLIASYRKNTPNSLLVDAGDFSQGQPIASVTKGQAMLDMMIAAGYDAIAVGNHEFDYTAADLLAMATTLKDANIPFLTNLGGTGDYSFLSAGGNGFAPYTIKEVDGVKIGIFAITTPDTLVTGSPTKLADVDFMSDPTVFNNYVAATCNELKTTQGCDVIVALTHCGYDTSGHDAAYSSGNVAAAAAGKIDVIIDGHAHQSLMGDSSVTHSTGTLIVSSGTALANLGKVELTVENGVVTNKTSAAISSSKATADGVTPDPQAAAAIQTVVDDLEPLFNEVIGTTTHNLWGGNVTNGYPDATAPEYVSVALPRRVETNLGSLVADARLWQAKEHIEEKWPQYADYPIVCFQVGGGVRATIEAGEITMRDVLAVMPFGSREYYVLITPEELYKVLENGVSALTTQDPVTGALSANGGIHGRFPQVAGMKFTFNIDGTAGVDRVTDVYLPDGTRLDPTDNNTQLVLVTTEYEVGGGDGYAVLQGKTQFDDNDPNSAAFVKYVKEVLGGVVDLDASFDGRINMINTAGFNENQVEYTLHLKEDGEDITSGTYTVLINGEKLNDFPVASDGTIKFYLPASESFAVQVKSPTGFVSSEGLLEHRAGLSDHYYDEAFSTVVKEPEIVDPDPEDPPKDPPKDPSKNPETGDPVFLYTILGVISAAAIVDTKRKIRK